MYIEYGIHFLLDTPGLCVNFWHKSTRNWIQGLSQRVECQHVYKGCSVLGNVIPGSSGSR